MYTNVPIQETKISLNSALEINMPNDEMKHELLNGMTG